MSEETNKTDAVVSATTGGFSVMADDSIKVVLYIDPRYADLAFQIFGVRGLLVAVARIQDAPSGS